MKKIALMLVGVIVALAASAQVADFKSIYNITRDTVTNTATIYLQSPALSSAPATTTTVWVSVTKISGTVGGTITLQGSLDGTTYKAINTVGTQTALATITATDASNTYHWILQGSPFTYYRVSWTGTGTMAASFTSQIFRAKP
jgi:K+-sensing histidine kinase KdpD